MPDNNQILNSASKLNIQKIHQNPAIKKTDPNPNTGKSFETILNEQRIKNEQSSGSGTQKPLNNTNTDSANIKTLTASDIQLRQYALNIRSYEPELTFSKHAKQRLAQRNIDIDTALIEKISGAVKKASDKNIKNALVLSGESAFIVSIDNNVVVTAMNNQEMRENVITNIDGTVII